MALKSLTGNPITAQQTSAAPLTTTSTPCGAIYIEALAANASIIYIGDSAVLAATLNGKELGVPVASSPLPFWSIPCGSTPKSNNLNQIYLSTAGATQKVNVFYEDD